MQSSWIGYANVYVLVLPGKNFIDNDIEIVFWIGKSLQLKSIYGLNGISPVFILRFYVRLGIKSKKLMLCELYIQRKKYDVNYAFRVVDWYYINYAFEVE
jgi:hypothetical protein